MDDGSAKKPNFFERVLSRLSNDTPENVDEILEVLRAAADNEAVDNDTLQLLENVLDFGDMEVRDVEAVVMPHALPFVLLGNSFLRGFQMSRNNEQMVLEKRP